MVDRCISIIYNNNIIFIYSGPPNAVQADIKYEVKGNDAIFSITVSDKSKAPAREILIHVEVNIILKAELNYPI